MDEDQHRKGSKQMQSDSPDRDSAFRNLINAAWRFLKRTENQRELQDMDEYRELGHATNEAASANAKVPAHLGVSAT
jgi:hypothetical protein